MLDYVEGLFETMLKVSSVGLFGEGAMKKERAFGYYNKHPC